MPLDLREKLGCQALRVAEALTDVAEIRPGNHYGWPIGLGDELAQSIRKVSQLGPAAAIRRLIRRPARIGAQHGHNLEVALVGTHLQHVYLEFDRVLDVVVELVFANRTAQPVLDALNECPVGCHAPQRRLKVLARRHDRSCPAGVVRAQDHIPLCRPGLPQRPVRPGIAGPPTPIVQMRSDNSTHLPAGNLRPICQHLRDLASQRAGVRVAIATLAHRRRAVGRLPRRIRLREALVVQQQRFVQTGQQPVELLGRQRLTELSPKRFLDLPARVPSVQVSQHEVARQ